MHCEVDFHMIDIHSHILAGIDDGAEDELEMLEMCRIAREDGISSIVATPHSFDGKYLCEPAEIKGRVSSLNEALSENGIDLRILPGMEVRIVAELPQHLSEGRILAVNEGNYVLLEFHPSHIPAGFENLLKDLIARGFGAILAHPEKNAVIQRRPEYLYKLIEEFDAWKLLVQITAESVIGIAGFRAGRTAKILLQHDLAHLIATDAHSSKGRPPQLSQAVTVATRLVGEEKALKMVTQIPLAVLGEEDFPDGWDPKDPKRWWRII